MNRTIVYLISEAEHNLRIEQYLRRRGYSRQNLTELKKLPDSIQVNRDRCILKKILSAGDELVVRIRETECSEKIPAVNIPFQIIYEDEDILVVNKPAGLPMHPSMKNYRYSLANALVWYYQQQNEPFIFRCANRLDRDTSGLTVVAKHMVSANILSGMGYRHEIEREYLAIIRGRVVPASGTIDAPLSRREGSIIERKVDFEKGERAVTHYQVVEEKNGHSLVSLRLETGRTHQIRIHLKYLGFPLIGDYLYNPDMEWISRQALHSYRLHFDHPITRASTVCYLLKNDLLLKGFCIELYDGHLGKGAVVAADPINILFCARGHIVNAGGIHIDGLNGFPVRKGPEQWREGQIRQSAGCPVFQGICPRLMVKEHVVGFRHTWRR